MEYHSQQDVGMQTQSTCKTTFYTCKTTISGSLVLFSKSTGNSLVSLLFSLDLLDFLFHLSKSGFLVLVLFYKSGSFLLVQLENNHWYNDCADLTEI